MVSSLDRPSFFQCPLFFHTLFSFSLVHLVSMRPRGKRRGINTALTSNSKTKPLKTLSPQLQFDARSSGSSRIVAGGVASSRAPTSSSTSSCASTSACYDEELYFRGRTVLSSACGVTTKRYTCSERVVAAEYCSFSSGGPSAASSSNAAADAGDGGSDDDADSSSRDSSGAADEALAVVCEYSVVSLCPGLAAVECPLDRGGRDRAWRLPRGCGLLLSSSSSSSGSSGSASSSSSSSPSPPAPVVLSHPVEEPATLPAIRYGEERETGGEEEAELGDLAGETVLFVGRLCRSSSSSAASSALGDRLELRDTGWFAVTTRSDDAPPSSSESAAAAALPTTPMTTLWALSRCSAKKAAAAAAAPTGRRAPAGAPQSSTGGAFASTPGGGAAAAAARRGAAAAAGTPRTPAGAPLTAATPAAAAAQQQQLGLSPTAAATTHAAALAAATAGKGRRCDFFSRFFFLREGGESFLFTHALLSCFLALSFWRPLSCASRSIEKRLKSYHFSRDGKRRRVVLRERLVLLPDLGVAHQVDVRLHSLLLRHAGELGPVVVLGAGLEREEAGPVALDVAERGLVVVGWLDGESC